MARPERNDIDYFPHEVNHGRKMHILESKYGNDGYAVWFKLLEQLGKASYHFIDVRDEANFMYLESVFKTDKTEEILNDLAKLGAIDKQLWEQRIIWSQKFVDSVQDAYKKRLNNCQTFEGLGLLIEGLRVNKPTSEGINSGNNPQRIGEDSIEDHRIVNNLDTRKAKFIQDCAIVNTEKGIIPAIELMAPDGDFRETFISYWTRTTPKGKKMEFEKKSTFDIPRRLTTWAINLNKFTNSNQQHGQNATASHKRVFDELGGSKLSQTDD